MELAREHDDADRGDVDVVVSEGCVSEGVDGRGRCFAHHLARAGLDLRATPGAAGVFVFVFVDGTSVPLNPRRGLGARSVVRTDGGVAVEELC